MFELSRFVRLAALLGAMGCESRALAQMPVWLPDDSPAVPAPSDGEASQPPAVSPLPRHAEPALSPVAPAATPAPAKAVMLTEQHSAVAAADEQVKPKSAPVARRTWYGWQTLAADAATLSTFVAVGVIGERGGSDEVAAPLSVIGVLGYEFAPGIVHFAHRHPGRGFASFGIRLGLPLAGALLGASVTSGCNGFLCEAGGAAVGSLVGVGGAIAIDAAVFAYDDPLPDARARTSLVPLVVLTRERALFGLGGAL